MLGAVEVVVATVGIGLKDVGPTRQMPGRMFFPTVGRAVIEGCRGCPSCKGAVVTQTGPDPGSLRAALCHQWHGRIIGMQSLGTEDMGMDQIVDRLQRHSAGPDLVSQGGKDDLDTFLGVAFDLPVQGLVLAELLEQHHGQQVGPRPAPSVG